MSYNSEIDKFQKIHSGKRMKACYSHLPEKVNHPAGSGNFSALLAIAKTAPMTQITFLIQ